ncbi:alpha-ketoglutarate-dependent dioxygenase AlkB [Stenotrophomonas maltophilia]|nr:alpha-ketoglutarate-dependent dioxygenase AlkB [Stenotrophomonas maltophilia]
MTADQLDLLDATTREPDRLRAEGGGLLGLVLDQAEFLYFLSSEWVEPSSGHLVLGVRQPCGSRAACSTDVAIWFSTQLLSDQQVMVWRNGTWLDIALEDLLPEDEFVSWHGPMPAFAVDHFCVNSEAVKAKLLALAHSFVDMEVPIQPFNVCVFSQSAPPGEVPSMKSCPPPRNWNALRGAAAMAAFAVPAIDPWIELFCDLVDVGSARPKSIKELGVPWWEAAIWSRRQEQSELPALWRAIVARFGDPERLKDWRAKNILDEICKHALLLGENPSRLEKLSEGAKALLDDRGTVMELGAHDDFLALTLQLVLLRPTPERFLGWREDWPAIPPGVWWTGMTLAGYIQGYRSLPIHFRGSPECRKLLALKTWQNACEIGSERWASVTPKKLTWNVDADLISMTADGMTWAEHRLGTRGSWYRADLDNSTLQAVAQQIALEECPESLDHSVSVENKSIQVVGDGVLDVEEDGRVLNARGRVEFVFGQGVSLAASLNTNRFRVWLATASISRRLARPRRILAVDHMPDIERGSQVDQGSTPSIRKVSDAGGVRAGGGIEVKGGRSPQGLSLLPNFITDEEESRLVSIIDSLEWDRTMKRQVQHYGWRYDYKARQIRPENFLGPLPDWASELAERLLAYGVLTESPDQVIVNNYYGNQGISKHIDCKGCFRGPIVTVSLLETWDMIFTRKINSESLKFIQPLLRCSAVVLAGESRNSWQHEIPQRIKEHGIRRERRLSITFRKVSV